MNKYLIPDITVDSIDDLSGEFFRERGIKAVFLDIDNTLVTPKTAVPDERASRFLKSLEEAGITACLVSNNKRERVETFSGGKYMTIHRAGKPFTLSYRRFLRKLSLKKSEVAAVGDQFYSDVYAAKKLGILMVYVKPIEIGNEGPFVHFKRQLERKIIAKLGI